MPIPYKEIKFCFWFGERHSDHIAIVDSNWTEPTRSLLKFGREEIEEASDLVFHLKHICPVPTRLYGTVSTRNSILP